jgi:hypothetical protein
MFGDRGSAKADFAGPGTTAECGMAGDSGKVGLLGWLRGNVSGFLKIVQITAWSMVTTPEEPYL